MQFICWYYYHKQWFSEGERKKGTSVRQIYFYFCKVVFFFFKENQVEDGYMYFYKYFV